MSLRLFTSESVTEGHPDKICDQISDSILDAMIASDPTSRVAVETMVTTGLVHVAGEVTTSSYVDIPRIVRDTVLGIGYDSSTKGFDGNSCGVSISIGAQSPDIAQGVDDAYEHRAESAQDPLDAQGAGDQGLMFGYATDETAELMPLPIWLAHRLSEQLTKVRKDGELPYLRPDGKTQVTIGYQGDRAVALVRDRDLGLAVGPQVGHLSALADLGQPLGEAVGQPDGKGHQLRGLVAGVAEHQALVAGALQVERVLLGGGSLDARLVRGVDTLGDVGRLLADRDRDAAGRAVEALGGGVVADPEDRPAHDGGDVGVGRRGHLTGDVHQARGDHGLHRDPAAGVVGQERVEHGVADLVADLVGVALGDGLGGKQLAMLHGKL